MLWLFMTDAKKDVTRREVLKTQRFVFSALHHKKERLGFKGILMQKRDYYEPKKEILKEKRFTEKNKWKQSFLDSSDRIIFDLFFYEKCTAIRCYTNEIQ